MNQQDIFQNMTKGEWEVFDNPDYSFIQITSDANVDTCILDFSRNTFSSEADPHAMASAVNNTYGKGINPESVEKMKQALEKISNWLVCAAIASADDMAQSFPKMLQISEEALTASKL